MSRADDSRSAMSFDSSARRRSMTARSCARNCHGTSSAIVSTAKAAAAMEPMKSLRRTLILVIARLSAQAVGQLVAELLDRDERVHQHGQLLAQPADVHVHGARPARVLVAPDVAEQQIARQHAAGRCSMYCSSMNSLAVSFTSLPVGRHDVRGHVHHERAVAQQRALGLGALGAPQQRPRARDELVGAERLRHVVVGAELEARRCGRSPRPWP